jgi:imidazoleglycerol-phosphate dehydratase
MGRTATINRKTGETEICLEINLDGSGNASIATGVGFLDHMLTLFAKHSLFDLVVQATGDLHVDDHHTVEDVGICLGLGLAEAVGEKRGIARYGFFFLPMDETLAGVALDLSGRAAIVWDVVIDAQKIGTFDTELAEEFWSAVSRAAQMNYHATKLHGRNAHHIVEAIFKASARALRMAVEIDPRQAGQIPSTKGTL